MKYLLRLLISLQATVWMRSRCAEFIVLLKSTVDLAVGVVSSGSGNE